MESRTLGELRVDDFPDNPRASKRVKISNESPPRTRDALITAVVVAVTGSGRGTLDTAIRTEPTYFRGLNDNQQSQVLQLVGRASCQLSASTFHSDFLCPECDNDTRCESRVELEHKDVVDLLAVLSNLQQHVERGHRTRIAALDAYRRVLNHIYQGAQLTLTESQAGKFVLRMLRNTSREARMAAASSLQAFCKQRHSAAEIVKANRITTLGYLQALWQSGKVSFQEAVVTALARVAEVSGDQELNIILLRLVEYLGYPNIYVASLVPGELLRLAQIRSVINIQGLFRPFWRTLGVVIIKTAKTKPAIAQQICEMLGMQMTGLLQLVEEHVLPHLVLNTDLEMIKRLAEASNTPMSLFDLCAKQSNLTKILALLLAQAYPDPEETIMKVLLTVSGDFAEQDLAGWISVNHSQIAVEMLKAAADAGVGKGSKLLQGLQMLAQLAFRRGPSSSSGSRRSDMLPLFLESNALEIITLFTSKLDDTQVRETNVERRRCILAIGEFTKLCKVRMRPVLPQICACLRSAMNEQVLRDAAFRAWSAMVSSLGEDDMVGVLDSTFALTVKYWSSLDPEIRGIVQTMIAAVFQKHVDILRENYDTVPSLSGIPELSSYETDLVRLRRQADDNILLAAFSIRLQDDMAIVVERALIEMTEYLRRKHQFVRQCIVQETVSEEVPVLIRQLLDTAVKFNTNQEIVLGCAECLGVIGCVDPSSVESIRPKDTLIILSNFAIASDTITFLMYFMEQIIVKEYIAASSLRSKTFLGWALQKLLELCQLPTDIASRTRVGGLNGKDQQWLDLAQSTRLVLVPFLTSHFNAPGRRSKNVRAYPIYHYGISYSEWLSEFVLDLFNRGPKQNVDGIFEICWRMVEFSKSTVIPEFLLPYAIVNAILNGSDSDRSIIQSEVEGLFNQSLARLDQPKQDVLRRISQTLFHTLDYCNKWEQEKKRWLVGVKTRAERGIRDPLLDVAPTQIAYIEKFTTSIRADVITKRSIECREYARALLHWEEYINSGIETTDKHFQRLQNIYAQIDEPDGIEGISTRMKIVSTEAQILEHKTTGRWHAVQDWYETRVTNEPQNVDLQVKLLHALKESGQQHVLYHHVVHILQDKPLLDDRIIPYAVESAWSTGQFDAIQRILEGQDNLSFDAHIGLEMLRLRQGHYTQVHANALDLVLHAGSDLTHNSTASIAACTESRLKMHVAEDIRLMLGADLDTRGDVIDRLRARLSILGTNDGFKQYLLNIHRAMMSLRPGVFEQSDIARAWLDTARLARKSGARGRALDAVTRAASLGEQAVVIEHAKLTWLEGEHRKAIRMLESAIETGAFKAHDYRADRDLMTSEITQSQNDMIAKAYVMLGKWLDQAGQTQSEVIIRTFRKSTEHNRIFESGWYYLGRHYNRILESERLKQPGKEIQQFLTGEAAKVVIDNFLKALACGNKYLFETLPKVLTLWLELVSKPDIEQDVRRGNTKFHEHLTNQRKKIVADVILYVKKYVDRLQPATLYTILPQLVARITHSNQQVCDILQAMIAKVIKTYPQQAMWTLMAVIKSADKVRAQRGVNIISKIVELQKKDSRSSITASELRTMISAAQRFTDEILRIADYHIDNKVSRVSLAREFGFNHKIAPSKLVVPAESCLTPIIPPRNDSQTIKTFKSFPANPVTITAFLDEALVLSSLQKPRRLSLRGSDGNIYMILAKPKDDLRKDQRLLEFDTMINRFLKRDVAASKRQLYIRTYAVIPLNEECGLIEWVNNLQTMRDVLLKLYRERSVQIDYHHLRQVLDDICSKSSSTVKQNEFTSRVLMDFRPVLRYYFIETFPSPTAWLAARTRYTRSAAVMSMVGHILGLGDRHGENILFEEDTGGIMHVDFNCLFDKGLTFDKPECVPFRLTHNMEDAFGPFGVEGPFRKCSEITMDLLRSHEDGLMTILETFLHDPTTDFMTAGKRRKKHAVTAEDGTIVPDTAEKMLEGVRAKVRGMLAGESVPLSVGGYVEQMIKQATDRANLARMYIGWCAFL